MDSKDILIKSDCCYVGLCVMELKNGKGRKAIKPILLTKWAPSIERTEYESGKSLKDIKTFSRRFIFATNNRHLNG